jgi:hypothetical protein
LGFYDPSPGARKTLRIEYVFHDMLHVVEVGDYAALVLPLRGKYITLCKTVVAADVNAAHLVDGGSGDTEGTHPCM